MTLSIFLALPSCPLICLEYINLPKGVDPPPAWCAACRTGFGHVTWRVSLRAPSSPTGGPASQPNLRGQRWCTSHEQDTLYEGGLLHQLMENDVRHSLSSPLSFRVPLVDDPCHPPADIARRATVIASTKNFVAVLPTFSSDGFFDCYCRPARQKM